MVGCLIDQGWTIEATADRFQVGAKTVTKRRDWFLAEGDSLHQIVNDHLDGTDTTRTADDEQLIGAKV
jgi:hypothetical protein